ncbi:MAG: HAMP domain-containing histidine kinase [Betaproteobacteria bacterium]|nr:HAMP domain-containing histidine kinase [Betaproteobacteria bacterium]
MSAPITGLPERAAPLTLARDNLWQLVLFRTIAIAGQIVTVAFVHGGLEIPLPLLPLAAGIGFLALFNLATWLRLRFPQPISDGELFWQILVDVAVFTVLLYFTGGTTNPFSGMYVLPIAVAAVMLARRSYTWGIAAVTGTCYLLLMFFHVPLVSASYGPLHQHHELIEIGEAINFAITIPLVVYFVIKITTMLREHQHLLAQANESEQNNERIVQLGAFAAGAAHELSTPLSTMAVVVKELQGRWHKRPELLNELHVISDQIELCKGTLSNLLASAGRARMDGGGKLALDKFLKSVVENCRSMRPGIIVTCRWHGALPAPDIVADQSLRQAIMNLLNNAADASPEQVEVEGRWDEQELCIRICDRGQGILPEAADKIGKWGFTTKPPGKGTGVGLVLTNAIISRFGGSVKLFNQPGCGACTEVRLPLSPFLVSTNS